jgi:tRNA A-37 threonylcarbamoyl transferase component Bud32
MNAWHLTPHHSDREAQLFSSLTQVYALQGEHITASPISEVIRVEADGKRYYVKRYSGAGKHLQAWLGDARVEAEWKNLQRFTEWGIPTARIVAYGLKRHFGRYISGALITEELPGTEDLAQLARSGDPRLCDRSWVARMAAKVARITRTLHRHRFAHNDLKWRNILVDANDGLYLIDCPAGRFWRGPFLDYRVIKDLACLDKVAKHHLSRTQRLRFYLTYLERSRLTTQDKRQLRRILVFFEGRE